MKKHFILSALLVFASLFTILHAQTRAIKPYKKGRIDLVAGVGLFPTQMLMGKSKYLPMHVGLEYWLNKKFSMSLMGGTASMVSNLTDNGLQWTNTTYMVAARPIVHFSRSKKWDIYGGIMLAYFHQKIVPNNQDEVKKFNGKPIRMHHDKIIYSAMVGAKRSIGQRVTVFAEAGYSISMLTTGVGYQIRN